MRFTRFAAVQIRRSGDGYVISRALVFHVIARKWFLFEVKYHYEFD